MRPVLICLGLSLVLASFSSFAHKPSDSYLTLKIQEQSIQGQWDIALRDLDYAIGLDSNDDGFITWGELRTRHDALALYAMTRLKVMAGGSACTKRVTQQLVDYHSDGAYSVLRFTVDCPMTSQTIDLDYSLLFDLDPTHRGLLRLQYQGGTQTAVFSPQQPGRRFELAAPSPWREFVEFAREGVWHIWIGYDHILFLLSLLLPAVLRLDAGRWRAVQDFHAAFWTVVKIVTAFTVAHSITLSLAALGVINLPSRWVESAIAASVLFVALNNLYPIVGPHLWWVAFAFGLVHGLGFANVLLDLDLPRGALLTALVGFNLGVEAGQLAIVATFLPVAFAIRRSWLYQNLLLRLGSLLIAATALIWLLERSLDQSIAR